MSESIVSESIEIKKETLWKVAAFIFAALWLFSLYSNGSFGNVTGNSIKEVSPTIQDPSVGNVQVKIDGSDPILGDKNAEISIVEFSDFQCPFCARANSDAVAQFKKSDYYKNGKVNLVYKHFPLNSIHPFAQKAAEAAVCAQDQGKFWEMHDKIFANQNALSVDNLKSYAKSIGLNQAKFDSCLDGGKSENKVSNDIKQSTDAGAQGTPYFVVVNNKDGETKVVSGAQPWVNFEAAINSL
ncbi:MAG: DsbA family protein [Nanoarchaeota archaeon]